MKLKNKILFCLIALNAIILSSRAQSLTNINELTDPNKVDYNQWNTLPNGVNISFANIDQKFTKSALANIEPTYTASLKGWKGEKLSAQILVWTRQDIANLKVAISDFKSNRNKLNSDIAKTHFVRYVMTDVFGNGCGARKPSDFPSSLTADILDNGSSFNVEKYTTRPIWISLEIPRNAIAGKYQSKISITANGNLLKTLDLNLEVMNRTLPLVKDWAFHLDLWQHPSAVARVNGLKMWSDEHFAAIKPVMKRLADAGQKVITTTLNKDPWNVQTYDPYADMIIWNKQKDGSWKYDYKVFDRYVALMMGLGVDKMINCYSIIPWNNRIHYFDLATDKFIDVEAKPGTEIFKELWTPFLKDFEKHLKTKGWNKITNIAMDERSRAQMDAAFALMKEVAPELGIAYADNQKTYKRYPNSQDISIAIGHPFDKQDLIDRRSRGLNSTFYICCSDSFPNTLTFSDPAEATYLGWYALATGFDGLLRWSYNSWVKDPLHDSRFRTWPAGDTYIVYPQNRSSIRFERLREGIQDYEKASIILKELASKNSTKALDNFNKAIEKLNNNQRIADWNKNLNDAKIILNSF